MVRKGMQRMGMLQKEDNDIPSVQEKTGVLMPARIIIGGDIVPTKSNYHLFENGDVETLLGHDLSEKLSNTDYTILNLEVPLTDKETPITKCGPNLIAPTKTIAGLQKINPHFFTLANNHILDQGEQGLTSTINLLDGIGVMYAGVGENLSEAARPYIKDIKGVRIGIYCCAEHEFSIATEMTAGANPFDALVSLDHVEKMKRDADFVIVLYHGGKEYYRYPSPNLQRVCRKLVEKGADLVVCQYSHCIGCEEEWQGGKIVYGQGNFLFDHSDSEYWQTSLLIELEIEKNQDGKLYQKVQYVPLKKTNETIRAADGKDFSEILDGFLERSCKIQEPGFVMTNYAQFAKSKIDAYFNAFAGSRSKRLLYRVVNKLSGYRYGRWIHHRGYRQNEVVALRNFIECEAHRELLLEGLVGFK